MIKELDALWVETDENIETIANKLTFEVQGAKFSPQFKAGFWDGKKRLYKLKDGKIFIPRPLANKLFNHLKIDYKVSNHHTPITELELPANLPFQPYEYQKQAVIDSINNNTQINVMATGSGKSFSIYLLVYYMLSKGIQTVLIVPNISLLAQMKNDFISYGFTNHDDIKIIGGDYKDKNIGSGLTISTWQSLVNYSKQLSTVGCIIEDECHKAGSESHIAKILPHTKNAYYRFGFTGTMPKDRLARAQIMSNFGSPKVYITPSELISMGLATKIEIQPLYLRYKTPIMSNSYQTEKTYFSKHVSRHKTIAEFIKTLKGNTLVLFDILKQGDLLKTLLPEAHLITGVIKGKDRENIINICENSDNNIILGSAKIMNTGINMRTLKNVVFVSGGKSYIAVNQSIGRVLRTHKNKNTVFLYDFVDYDGRFMLKHYKERYHYYCEHEYPINNPIIFEI